MHPHLFGVTRSLELLISVSKLSLQAFSLLAYITNLPIRGQLWQAEGDGGSGDEDDVEQGQHGQQVAERGL